MKFTAIGEVELRAEYGAGPDGAAELRFSVRDTGVGIAADAQPHLFQSFSQADSTTTRRYGGTGLGLAITHQPVELMGGRMGLESREGVGTRIWLTLPYVPAPLLPLPAGKAPTPMTLPRFLHAVVVEPNACARHAVLQVLEHLGVPARGVATLAALGADAPVPALPAPVDLVLVAGDASGPDSRRGELARARWIRMAPIRDAESRGEAAPMVEWVAKPVTETALRDVLGAPGARAPAATDLASPAMAAGVRVLLAEDNAVNAEIATELLRTYGCSVTRVADGRQALALFESAAFDIVFMDCQMPVVDGFEAARAMRAAEAAHATGCRTPIIALTANAMSGDCERCLDAGMDDHLGKPFRREQLGAALRQWLRPGQAARETAVFTAADGAAN